MCLLRNDRSDWLSFAWPSHMSPLCPPEALRNAEQQETNSPEQTGPGVHPLCNNTITYPTITAVLDIYEHLHIQVHRKTSWLVAAVQTPQ